MGARLINGRKKKKRLAHRKGRLKAEQKIKDSADMGANARQR